MENNTQLPVEVVEEIEQQADSYADKYMNGRVNTHEHGLISEVWTVCATAYAIRLHQVEQENAELRRQNDKMKQEATGWRPLLEKVLREDAVLCTVSIPTLEKIKKFLYGE